MQEPLHEALALRRKEGAVHIDLSGQVGSEIKSGNDRTRGAGVQNGIRGKSQRSGGIRNLCGDASYDFAGAGVNGCEHKAIPHPLASDVTPASNAGHELGCARVDVNRRIGIDGQCGYTHAGSVVSNGIGVQRQGRSRCLDHSSGGCENDSGVRVNQLENQAVINPVAGCARAA